jgi:hypothetical protein
MRNHFTNKTFRSSIGQLAQYSIINLSLCFLDNVLMGNRFANNQGVINLANNFTCGRNSVMGNIVTYASPYLYPFVVEYSLIGAAVVFAMWRSIGSNPRYYSPPSSLHCKCLQGITGSLQVFPVVGNPVIFTDCGDIL